MKTVFFVMVALATAVAIFIGYKGSNRSNIKERTQHWQTVISKELTPGASEDDLQQFAARNGQSLQCKQARADLPAESCELYDHASQGGTPKFPVQLVVTFKLKEGHLVAHEINTVLVKRAP